MQCYFSSVLYTHVAIVGKIKNKIKHTTIVMTSKWELLVFLKSFAKELSRKNFFFVREILFYAVYNWQTEDNRYHLLYNLLATFVLYIIRWIVNIQHIYSSYTNVLVQTKYYTSSVVFFYLRFIQVLKHHDKMIQIKYLHLNGIILRRIKY